MSLRKDLIFSSIVVGISAGAHYYSGEPISNLELLLVWPALFWIPVAGTWASQRMQEKIDDLHERNENFIDDQAFVFRAAIDHINKVGVNRITPSSPMDRTLQALLKTELAIKGPHNNLIFKRDIQ